MPDALTMPLCAAKGSDSVDIALQTVNITIILQLTTYIIDRNKYICLNREALYFIRSFY